MQSDIKPSIYVSAQLFIEGREAAFCYLEPGSTKSITSWHRTTRPIRMGSVEGSAAMPASTITPSLATVSITITDLVKIEQPGPVTRPQVIFDAISSEACSSTTKRVVSVYYLLRTYMILSVIESSPIYFSQGPHWKESSRVSICCRNSSRAYGRENGNPSLESRQRSRGHANVARTR